MEEAESALSLIEQVNAGGVPLVALVVAVAAVLGLIHQYRANLALQRTIQEQNKQYSSKVEELLREMISRGEDQQEIISGNTQAMKDHTGTLQVLSRMIERLLPGYRPPTPPGSA